MRKLLIAILSVILLAFAWLALFPVGQRPDRSFDARVAHPAYATQHPVVLFDQAHYNAHAVGGNFAPFAKLLRNDGFELKKGRERVHAATLAGVDVLVIVNAAGGSNPKLFGSTSSRFVKETARLPPSPRTRSRRCAAGWRAAARSFWSPITTRSDPLRRLSRRRSV